MYECMRIKVCKISYQAGCLYRATFIELKVENKAIVSRYVKISYLDDKGANFILKRIHLV